MVASAMALSISATPVLAENQQDTPVIEDPVEPQSIGPLLTSAAGSFSNGSGSFTCYLGGDHWWPDIMAGVSVGSGSGGAVSCYVHTPDNNDYYLGTVPTSGGHTSYEEFTYCEEGYYTFYFSCTNNDTIYAYGRIYQ